MKYIIFVILFFIVLTCEAQYDTLVCIKKETAEYFLEKDDEATIRKEKNILDSAKISNLQTQLVLKDSIITTYRYDSLSYNSLIETYSSDLTLKDKEIVACKKSTRIQRIAALVIIGLILIVK